MMIGGKDRELRYTKGAIRRLEIQMGSEDQDRTRVPITELFQRLQKGEIGLIVELTWAGLLHEDKDLEVDTVGDWLDETVDAEALITEIGEGVENSFGFGKKKTDSKSKTTT